MLRNLANSSEPETLRDSTHWVSQGTCAVWGHAAETSLPGAKNSTEVLIVRSPFRAKHHVVVQCMAAGLKCPLPPPPYQTPLPPWPDPPPMARPPPCGQTPAWLVEDKEDKEELMSKEEFMTLPMPQGTSHCFLLYQELQRNSQPHDTHPTIFNHPHPHMHQSAKCYIQMADPF